MLYAMLWCHAISYYVMPHCITLHHIMMYCIVLYHIILCVFYYIILSCTILYCIIGGRACSTWWTPRSASSATPRSRSEALCSIISTTIIVQMLFAAVISVYYTICSLINKCYLHATAIKLLLLTYYLQLGSALFCFQSVHALLLLYIYIYMCICMYIYIYIYMYFIYLLLVLL